MGPRAVLLPRHNRPGRASPAVVGWPARSRLTECISPAYRIAMAERHSTAEAAEAQPLFVRGESFGGREPSLVGRRIATEREYGNLWRIVPCPPVAPSVRERPRGPRPAPASDGCSAPRGAVWSRLPRGRNRSTLGGPSPAREAGAGPAPGGCPRETTRRGVLSWTQPTTRPCVRGRETGSRSPELFLGVEDLARRAHGRRRAGRVVDEAKKRCPS
jgi:hypothetical protein